MIGLTAKLAGWRGYAVLAAVSGATIGMGCWIARGWLADAEIARQQAVHSGVLESIATASSDAMRDVINEERRRRAALEAIRDTAEKQAASAAADAAAARAAAGRLRDRIETLAADARARYPAITEGGPSAGSAVDLLAHMLGRLSEAAGQLAGHADAARNAGLTCEASYDGVGLSEQ